MHKDMLGWCNRVVMMRRCIWGITRKTSKTGQSYCPSSTKFRSLAYDNRNLASTNFTPISNPRNEKNPLASNRLRYRAPIFCVEQPFGTISQVLNLSVQTKIMDGEGDRKVLKMDYDNLLEAQKNGDFIVDVREQNEINETGKLPGSIHIPMGDVQNQLETLSPEAFQTKFEKSKPKKDTKIILSCRSGMRSGKVQEQLQKLGYESVYNYAGGWLEWESKQKS